MTNRFGLPDLGLGIGLRSVHFNYVLAEEPVVDWFEILSENYLIEGGRPLYVLDRVAARHPIAMHGVSLSIGSTDPIDFEHVARLRALADRCGARWLGDHICWTGVAGRNTHELLPLPYDLTTLAHVADRVRAVQDFLQRPLVLENPSTYATFASSTLPEEEWVARLLDQADCAMLLDVNNVYVTCRNDGRDPWAWLDAMPFDRVVQVHVAGHTDKGTHLVDTHIGPVIEPVWELYGEVVARTGGVSTLLEWDAEIPDFPTVQAEVAKARAFRGVARSEP